MKWTCEDCGQQSESPMCSCPGWQRRQQYLHVGDVQPHTNDDYDVSEMSSENLEPKPFLGPALQRATRGIVQKAIQNAASALLDEEEGRCDNCGEPTDEDGFCQVRCDLPVEPPIGGWDRLAEWEKELLAAEGAANKPLKQCRLSEIDPWALEQLGRVAGHGSDNGRGRLDYLKGTDWSRYYDALQRHALAAWQGEDRDEDGFYHFAAVAWNALALLAYFHHGIGNDDRYKGEVQ